MDWRNEAKRHGESIRLFSFWLVILFLIIATFVLGRYQATMEMQQIQDFIERRCPCGRFEYAVSPLGGAAVQRNISDYANLNATIFSAGEAQIT